MLDLLYDDVYPKAALSNCYFCSFGSSFSLYRVGVPKCYLEQLLAIWRSGPRRSFPLIQREQNLDGSVGKYGI